MNKNILVKLSLTLLAGVTAFVFGKSDIFQRTSYLSEGERIYKNAEALVSN